MSEDRQDVCRARRLIVRWKLSDNSVMLRKPQSSWRFCIAVHTLSQNAPQLYQHRTDITGRTS